MKFAALVLLLAVGSQAASLQADAPDQLSQIREKVKETAIRILAPLDNTDYKEKKNHAVETVDQRLGQAIEMGQTAYSTALEATAGIRGTIMGDVQKLQADLADQAEKVRENVLRHVQDYIAALTPLKEHLESKKEEMEQLKQKVTSVVENIGEKVPTNWEETKGSLLPIYEKVSDQLKLRGSEAREQIEPYIKEYMDLAQGYAQDPSKGTPALEDVKAKFAAYVSALVESMNKN